MKRAMNKGVLVSMAILLVLAITFANAEAALVYDATAKPLNSWSPYYQPGYNIEAGDQVTLVGAERHVTGIDIKVFESYYESSGTIDAEVRFYKNDGPIGAPGTLIWDSGVIQNIPYARLDNSFFFTVPSVLVPDTFTWTIKFSNVQTSGPYNFGLRYYGTPILGSSGDYIWQYNNATNSWIANNDPETPNFGAAIHASGGQFQDILAHFDACVANSLIGSGPGNSANNRIGALRNMLRVTEDMLTQGDTPGACQQLNDVYLRMDGQTQPPDFVEGLAVPALAGGIGDFMGTLGCQ